MTALIRTKIVGALRGIRRLVAGKSDIHSEGFWVKGGSLVYVHAGHVHQVQQVIQRHREQEAKLEQLRMMIRR